MFHFVLLFRCWIAIQLVPIAFRNDAYARWYYNPLQSEESSLTSAIEIIYWNQLSTIWVDTIHRWPPFSVYCDSIVKFNSRSRCIRIYELLFVITHRWCISFIFMFPNNTLFPVFGYSEICNTLAPSISLEFMHMSRINVFKISNDVETNIDMK